LKGLARKIGPLIVAGVIVSIIASAIFITVSASRGGSDNSGISLSLSNGAETALCQTVPPVDSVPYVSYANQSTISHRLSNDSIRLLTLEIPPGSTGTLCVRFALSNGSVSAADLAAHVYSVQAMPLHPGSGFEYSYTPSEDLMITSNATELKASIGNKPTTFTVVYTLTSVNNTAGYYDLSLPNNCPPLLPLAVVGPLQSPSSSNFTGFFTSFQCRSQGNISLISIVGYNGLKTRWITG
jgi:hypothetical protein